MQKYSTLTDAIALAEFAHRNQLDKAGLPYVEHPKRVLAKVQAMGALPYVQIAAVLHDVTEDTAFTPLMLLDMGFSEAAVEIVKLLDRGLSEAWFNYEHGHNDIACTKDEFYYVNIKKNPGAKMVKVADISDNTEPWRLSYLSEETQARLLKKYSYANTQLS